MEHTLDYKHKPKYSAYKNRHEKFDKTTPMITEEKFMELSSQPCSYCGVKGPNGIDRIDSNKGYIEGNCVPSCKHCNYVKGNLSMQDFIAWTKRFVEFQKEQPLWD